MEGLHVGAREKPRLKARLRKDRRREGAGRPLAVRAGDMDELQAVLRAPQPIEKLADALKAEPGRQPTGRVDVFDCVERHASTFLEKFLL